MTTDSNARSLRFIGIDVATQPRNVGLAVAQLTGGALRLEEVAALETWGSIDAHVSHRLDEQTLIAIDAPLGWPEPLAMALCDHHAGNPLPATPNEIFRRQTDDVVARELGKRPLDVGADRIARTAHTALGLLSRLRQTTGLQIPLAEAPGPPLQASAIEVYPAGTLASRGLRSSGYKGAGSDASHARRSIIDAVRTEIVMPRPATTSMEASDHLLDAMLCCIAAKDFVQRNVMAPSDDALARREGWIWVAPRR